MLVIMNHDGPLILSQTLDADFLVVTVLFDTLTRCIKAGTGRASCCSESNIAADTCVELEATRPVSEDGNFLTLPPLSMVVPAVRTRQYCTISIDSSRAVTCDIVVAF